jgi:hypothetical protein
VNADLAGAIPAGCLVKCLYRNFNNKYMIKL